MTKAEIFTGLNVDLEDLYKRLKMLLVEENFKFTKDEITESTYHLRAVKSGLTTVIAGATRDVELVIAGEPNIFTITFRVGAWGKNLALPATAGTVLIGPQAGTVLGAVAFISAKVFEDRTWKNIKIEINKAKRKKVEY